MITKMSNRAAVLGSLLLVAFVSPLFARGQGPRRYGHGPGPGHHMMMRLADELDFTDAQRAELREILGRNMSGELGASIDALHKAKQALRIVIHDPAADDQTIIEASRAASREAERVALGRHRMWVEIDGLLTEEQRARAQELREERADRPGPFGPGRGPGRFEEFD